MSLDLDPLCAGALAHPVTSSYWNVFLFISSFELINFTSQLSWIACEVILTNIKKFTIT